MKFTYEGKTYDLSFERNHRNVMMKVRTGKNRELRTVRSTYPDTTAKLYELRIGELPAIVCMRTVGCLHTDKFSKESGRLHALKALSSAMSKLKYPKGLIAAMWDTYRLRKNVPAPKPVLLLPPSSLELI